ncbi:alpha-ketoacid dehydrogenase subunit beta [Tropicibacter sp. R16_0]|uniref:alpha-ketoacid dehydrogenase subunit beta n=1 Tax=Tropicibacter sp. R16_0 TaxID=2821102 RepID=UPI001ADCABEE|nr:transketolase C-terminal domain-containing protein [Tropicibacter sp. R16_0]MBO9453418.1 alpha-ketoacid dehydrogenase subunit beta [Tropicibacter sp. R16_0]
MTRQLPFIEAIREALREEMIHDDKVFLVGQDIRGAIYPHTKGLVDEFGPDRVVDTPISESGMYGMASGAALQGYRPVVDFMFGGFTYVTFSEATVTTGQQYFLHGSKSNMPLVITAGVGAGMRLANDHSMAIHGTFAHHPGIKVAMPSTPYDAKGMFKAAIRDNSPVVIPWHMALMMDKGEVPDEDYVVPLGKADIKREGADVTVVANSQQLKFALQVAEKLDGEISVEVFDPRSFVPFDMDLLLTSLAKTSRLVIVDEDWESGGFAATLSARVMEQGFDLLDAPVLRVTFPNMPIPGGVLEPRVMPNPERIEAAIRAVME